MTAELADLQYSFERATAIHEAGHAVMSFMLGRALVSITIAEDEESYGRVHARLPGEWFRPDIEVDSRVRNRIEDEVMIYLAGGETEGHWCARLTDAPDGWQEKVTIHSSDDVHHAIDLADYVWGGSPWEIEPYVEWLRERVLSAVGRLDADVSERTSPYPRRFVETRIRYGDDRFWTMVVALADALQEHKTLTWRQAREIMQEASHEWITARVRVQPPVRPGHDR